MKKLTDIRLINWHGFYDETIPVDGSVLIAGDNGSGKSSLIDAIYYLLSGGDASRFNSAAVEKTDRTVETYMRGRTGESSHPFLRPDKNIITHICLQFLDEKTLESFLIGVVLELQDGIRDILKTFYYVPNHVLEDSLFKDEDGSVLNFRLMQQKQPEGLFRLLGDSQRKVRQTLYNDILEIDGKKYLDLLPKAVSFKPIDDVHEFVYRFLMPEKDVDISSMRTVIHSLNELSTTVKEEESKKEALRVIAEKAEAYAKNKKEASLYQALALNLASSSIEEERNRLNKEIGDLEARAEELSAKRKSSEERKEALNKEIYALENDEGYLELKTIDDDIARAEKKASDCDSAARSFETRLAREASLAHSLSLGSDFLAYLEKKDYRGLRMYLPGYQAALKKKKDELNASYSEVRSSLRDDKKEALALEKEKEELEAGRTVYPEAFERLREIVIKRVKDQTGDEIEARPFAELIDLKEGEENWRGTIEALLGNRRFDLFVDPDHYPYALKALEEASGKENIYGIGLVDLARLPEDSEVLENSLATKLSSLTYDAGKYVNLLLGRVVASDTAGSFVSLDEGATAAGVAYFERSARAYDIAKESPFIGANSRRLRLEEVEGLLSGLRNDIALSEEEARETYSLLEKCEHSTLASIIEEPNRWLALDEANKALEDLRAKKKSLEGQNEDLTARSSRLTELRAEREKETAELAVLASSITDNASALGAAKSRLGSLQGDVKAKEEELENLLKKEKLAIAYEDFKKDKNLAAKEATAQVERLSKDIARLEKDLRTLMGSYIRRFSFDETSELDALPHFVSEYDKVANHDLVENLDKLDRAKRKASESFQNDYIAKIRESIEEEKRHIKKLNEILAGRPFGSEGDVYEFVISASKDSTFKDYYEIFASKEDYDQSSLFTEQLSSKNEALMASLYERFTSEDADAKILQSFTDYRNFMDYDIKIRDKNGRTYRFSEISKSKSGGETQTPFYVIIAASFDQLCRPGFGRTSPGCLVMFDEAFEKMDQSHVESMMRYFQELSIQPILAVPGNQAKAIAPYVDTKVALIKQSGRVIASPIIKARQAE